MLQLLQPLLANATFLAIGGLLGFLAKELIFPQLSERWKDRKALSRTYHHYRDPLFLAALELANRLHEICETYPTNFLIEGLKQFDVERLERNSSDDPYYRRYKFISSVYRFCAFFGWLELYRQEVVFLDSGRSAYNKAFEDALVAVRSDIADGHLNDAPDFDEWSDYIIFREELRAIGEATLCSDSTEKRSVVGYGRFSRMLSSDEFPHERHWFTIAGHFFSDLPTIRHRNFRLVRLQLLYLHLIDLMIVLDGNRVPQRLLPLYNSLREKNSR